jgi:hypothetical protein
MGEIEEQPGKKTMRFHSEKQVCPRRKKSTAVETVLSRRQTQRGGKAFWDPEESDRHPARCWGSRVASEPLLKVETIMRALCTRQGRRRGIGASRETLLYLHLHPLGTQQVLARPSMMPTTPITRSRRGAEPMTRGCSSTLTWRGLAVVLPCH